MATTSAPLVMKAILSAESRNKICYTGVDIDQHHARHTERLARDLFPTVTIHICALVEFRSHVDPSSEYDVVTCTNTIHEISPEQLATILVDALFTVTRTGLLFFYDMDRLSNCELGAVPWRAHEIQAIVNTLLETLGDSDYRPTVAEWPHRQCNGWNLLLNRTHLQLDRHEMQDLREQLISVAVKKIRTLLHKKLIDLHVSLERLSLYGPDSSEERLDTTKLLHDFWAISRSLKSPYRVTREEVS